MHERVETYFSGHRIMAFESVMKTQVDIKSKVEVIMAKAYLTFSASAQLYGFP